jgi:hypothetical protein
MPCPPPGSAPELFAIPGSHDWYDGLVNFTNLFCRQRPIGGRTTSQTRSYFAIRLPHRWWLWGIDLQFGDYLDQPQMAYFQRAAREIEPGDQIIVCMAKEVESGRRSAEVFSTRDLSDLEREVVKPAGASIALYLKSGRHYYARYEAEKGEAQLVTAGGGGAFLHPTHDLPEVAPPPTENGAGPFRLAAVYRRPTGLGGSGSGSGSFRLTTCRWPECWERSRFWSCSCSACTLTTATSTSASATSPGRSGRARLPSCLSSW